MITVQEKTCLCNCVLTVFIVYFTIYLFKYLNGMKVPSLNILESFADSKPSRFTKNIEKTDEIDTVFGTPITDKTLLSKKNSVENRVPIPGGESAFLFKYAKCTPECCQDDNDLGFSCSGGCVCASVDYQDMMMSRGNNFTQKAKPLPKPKPKPKPIRTV